MHFWWVWNCFSHLQAKDFISLRRYSTMPFSLAQQNSFNFNAIVNKSDSKGPCSPSLVLHLWDEFDAIISSHRWLLSLDLIISFLIHIGVATTHVQACYIVAAKSDFSCFITIFFVEVHVITTIISLNY